LLGLFTPFLPAEMETEKVIQDIRALISASEMDTALETTRQLLLQNNWENALVQLDMVESEWNNIQSQHINGLLSVDDYFRLQNINKAKLMELLLQISNKDELTVNLSPSTAAPKPSSTQTANQAFKDGLKNFVGVALMFPALGAFIGKDWVVGACFSFAAVITFIPSLRFIEKFIRYELLSWHKYVLVIGVLLLAGNQYKSKMDAVQPAAPTIQKAQ